MKKIRNPFDPQINKCFGCGPNNPIGLQLEFYEDNDHIISFWQPDENLQGYPDVVHGGIQTTLMDELASWTVFVKGKTAGFTTSMEIRLRKPLLVSKGRVKIVAKLKAINRKIAEIETEIYDSDKQLCSSGLIRCFIYPEDQARERFGLPEHDKFY
ncbi:MAG: PaaI family thioesterase [Bacteroidales bacterium]|nr:MAG: PaaI family thioesterase [Bacteroidales bacterium]